MKSFAHYQNKLRERSLRKIASDRLGWYMRRLQLDNPIVGGLVNLTGNRINLDGIVLDVDNPLIPHKNKSTIYFGYYEKSEREFSKRYLDRSLPTVEFGACIGGVSCTVNKILNDPSKHVVVECSPEMLCTLRKNRELNECKFEIEQLALAYGSETVSFGVADWMFGSLHRGERTIEVKSTTLEQLLNKYRFEKINLLSDCEGAEFGLTENELPILAERVKWLVMETHPEFIGEDGVSKMLADLASISFVVRERAKEVLALENTRI